MARDFLFIPYKRLCVLRTGSRFRKISFPFSRRKFHERVGLPTDDMEGQTARDESGKGKEVYSLRE